ncbi:MAG TPA: chromate transporter [Stellaceae bacterium]|nr:chromate transporter [Stellaceae bacterium]
MLTALEPRKPVVDVTLAALFGEFLRASLSGFGGGPVWVRHGVVERRRWLSEVEFADILSFCQFMPGPNAVGIAVCVGERLRGGIGALAALAGFLVIPWALAFSLGALLLEYARLPLLQHVLGGVSATAAGLLIATGIKLLLPHRRRPAAVLFAALAFGLMAFSGLPLLAVLFVLAPLSIAVAAISSARGR